MPPKRFNAGFTLIELAIVLFIIGLLIAGLSGPLETQLEARDRQNTIDTMNEAVEALYGYALTHGRLPCPNTDGDGMEQLDTNVNGTDDADDGFTPAQLAALRAAGGACLADSGFLPWTTLGTRQGDAWSNRFTYKVVEPDFTTVETDRSCDGNTAPEELDLCTKGNIEIDTRGDDPSTGGLERKADFTLASEVPAVIISHGRNGFGAWSTDGNARPAVPAGNADESQNADGDTPYMSRIYSRGQDGCDDTVEAQPYCAFDDIVVWLSPLILNNRMVVAGRLP